MYMYNPVKKNLALKFLQYKYFEEARDQNFQVAMIVAKRKYRNSKRFRCALFDTEKDKGFESITVCIKE